ncbi:MAG: hypothetical protein VB023_06155 [Oscillibacter sp.]|nr:hypothetical protein [Oscillibacter sp.]
MENQMERFDEIVKMFEAKCVGNEELLKSLSDARMFFAENFDNCKEETLAATLSCMWYCNGGNNGYNSPLASALGAIQRIAKGAKFKE